MRLNNILKNNKGMGLIEVIAALGIATMVITSLVSLSIFALRSSLKSKLLLEASKVANREMELIRAYRDRNTWDDFVATISSCVSNTDPKTPTCNMDLDSSVINTSGPTPAVSSMALDDVSRGFYIVQDGEVIQVTVVAQWKEGSALKNTTLRTDLTNWQQR